MEDKKYLNLAIYGVWRSKEPDLTLILTILKNDRNLFELDKNNVIIYVNGDEKKIIPYFKKIIKLYFREFVQKTLKEVVYLTSGKYPISEKEFINKYSYIIEGINKEMTKKLR